MLRRSISIILVIAFLFTMVIAFTACGKSVETKETTTAAADTEAAASETAKAKITFPYTGDPVEISFFYQDNSSEDRTYAGTIDEELTKLLGNIKIVKNLVPAKDLLTKFDLMAAAGDLADLNVAQYAPDAVAQKYGDSGNLLDYTPYLNDGTMPNYKAQADMYTTATGISGDKVVALAQVQNKQTADVFPFGYPMQVNGYYVNKFGIKVPTTSDELLDSLRAVKKANPKITAPWLSFPKNYIEMIAPMFLGVNMWTISEEKVPVTWSQLDQKWIYPLYAPGAKDMVAFMHTLYAEGLIPKDYDTMAWDKFVNILQTSGDGWFIHGCWIMMGEPQSIEIRKKFPEFVYMYEPVPSSKYIPKRILMGGGAEGGTSPYSFVTNSKTKNPELVCALMDFLVGDQVDTLINWGIEGKTFKKVEPSNATFGADKQFLPELKMGSHPNGTVDPAKTFGLYVNTNLHQFGPMGSQKTALLAQIQADVDTNSTAQFAKLTDFSKTDAALVLKAEPMPVFTADENDKITTTLNAVNTLWAKALAEFINGKRPMSDWDKFIEETKKAADVQSIVDLYNSKPRVSYFKK